MLENFNLPIYNKFKVNIEGFSSNYFAVGFLMVPNYFVDYSNSIFVDLATKERIQIADREEYKKSFSIGDRKRYPATTVITHVAETRSAVVR